MRILVVDDEELARTSLQRKIRLVDQNFDVDSTGDVWKALEILQTAPPDIVFLDIAMPGLTGFELLSHIPAAARTFHVIFCTAYSEHALRAFEEAATDYLLKPVEQERLEKSLSKVVASNWQQHVPVLKKLLVKTRTGRRVLPVEDISCLASEAHETVAYLRDGGEAIIALSLNQLEEQLDAAQFFRCHRSFLVALESVVALEDGNQPSARLSTGQVVPVARRRKSALISVLGADGKK